VLIVRERAMRLRVNWKKKESMSGKSEFVGCGCEETEVHAAGKEERSDKSGHVPAALRRF
jgi:hypothetical protein